MRGGRGHVYAPQQARPSQDAALTITAPAKATACSASPKPPRTSSKGAATMRPASALGAAEHGPRFKSADTAPARSGGAVAVMILLPIVNSGAMPRLMIAVAGTSSHRGAR